MQRATMLLKSSVRNPTALRSVLLALDSHAHGFGSVIKMVKGMIATNEKEQADEDQKMEFCTSEIAKTKASVKAHTGSVKDLDADIASKEDEIATADSEIAALQKGIEDLDKSVVEATEQRKSEHAEYTSTAAANQAAVELIGMAKNRMAKFYQPTLYKAPPTTTVSDSPYGFVQVSLRRRADPGPAPEMPSGEYKKNEQSGGVMAMMDQMMKDIEMDIAEGKRDEESAQKDYEEAMKDAATKRTDDTKLMVEKGDGKSEMEVNLQAARTDRATKDEQLGLAKDKMYDLEIDCNHILTNYDELKKNRATEVEGLKQSMTVLEGAGFLQK
jgi:chromosome segregation ATPase